ncbi:MAG: tetratricopeptide repeat protein [Gammaproteobacteria bacterium]|nr:tetratricopeptide repeat protein [Gammaproteobacteria bacterium]
MSRSGGDVGKHRSAADAKATGFPGSLSIAAFPRRDTLALLGLCVLVCVSYYPSLAGGFVWDDFVFTEAPVIREWSGLWNIWFSPADIRHEGHYWPIVYTTFYLEHKLWGFDPLGYHVVNLALHLVNSLLVWRLMGRLAVPGAWLIAAVFAVHPVHVESVAWIIERKDLLSGLFYLTAFLTWLRFVETPTVRGYALALALFVAGMLSKSIVVTLPAALLVWHWWRQGNIKIVDVVRLAPFFLVGLAISLADLAFYTSRFSFDSVYSLPERLLIAARALWFYAAKLVWPVDLAVVYPMWDIQTREFAAWLYVVAAVLLAAALWVFRHRIGRGPLAGALFFAVTLAPVLGFVDFGYMEFSLVADRFQYLASIGLVAVVLGGLTYGMRRLPLPVRHSAGGLAAVAIAALGVLAWQQSGVYRDGVTFFGHIVSYNPTARHAQLNLGNALVDAGRIEKGLAAIRIARDQQPDTPGPYAALGKTFMEQGRLEEAEEALQRAVEVDPKHRGALQNRAELARRQGRLAEAETRYRQVLAIDGEHGLANAGLGTVLFRQKRYAAALDHLRNAVGSPTIGTRGTLYVLMGRSAAELGYGDESEAYLDRAFAGIKEQRQDAPRLYAMLADALMDQGRFETAEAALREAIELDPSHRGALRNLGELARRRGQLAEAESRFREVLAIDEGDGVAHAGLGTVLFRQKRFAEALDHLRLAVEMPGTDETRGPLYLFMGQAAGELGDLEEAEVHLERAMAEMPENVLTLLAMAELRNRQGRVDEAATYRRRAGDTRPDDPTLLHRLAESLRNEGQIDEAIPVYEDALEIDPGNAPVHAGLGIALYQRGRFRAALDSMTRALELRPDLPYAVSLRLYSGHALRELGDIPAASGQYELAIEIEPGNRAALNHLAMSLVALERYEEAHGRYSELAELDPDNAESLANHGAVLHNLGRNEEALARIQRALELDPTLEHAQVLRKEVRKALALTDP